MTDIRIESVTKTYPAAESPAVDSVSLHLGSGEFFVLLGPSGCGKSTLLRLVAGLEDISDGAIYFGDRVVNYDSPADRNVAMVFQNYALYPHMTVRENVAFPLKMRGSRRAEAAGAVMDAARSLGLDDLLSRRVGELSGGQRQRVAVARAIVRRPAAMLMDEPLSNLDALLRMQTREELLRLHKMVGGTVMYVTHDQVEAMTMGDRIGVMLSGHLVQVGTPRHVYNAPVDRFVAGFIGSPPMNFINGRLVSSGSALVFEASDLRLRLPVALARVANARPVVPTVTLGVRPESISLELDGDGWLIDLVEDLGADRVVVARRGDVRVRARANAAQAIAEGHSVGLRFEPSGVHLFDDNGIRIHQRRDEARPATSGQARVWIGQD